MAEIEKASEVELPDLVQEALKKLSEKELKKIKPQAKFGADFICGFPTETETAFENTCRLVKEAGLNKLHVFPYSERSGTPAAKMKQLPMAERRRRAAILRELSEE